MAFKKITYPTAVSAKGVAVFPHLQTPDSKFNPDKPQFKVNLRVPHEDAQPLVAKIDAMLAEIAKATPAAQKLLREDEEKRLTASAKAKKLKQAEAPYLDETDENGEPTGNVIFKFKANAQYTNKDGVVVKRFVKITDTEGAPVTAKVSGGSVIRVGCQLQPWVNAKSEYSVKLALDAVRVIDLKTFGGADYDFGDDEGYKAGDADTAATDQTSTGSASGDDEDF